MPSFTALEQVEKGRDNCSADKAGGLGAQMASGVVGIFSWAVALCPAKIAKRQIATRKTFRIMIWAFEEEQLLIKL